MEESHTQQYVKEGETIKVHGVTLECVFVSYQERTKQGTATEENPGGEVERYNFTYSFRPQDDMERERRETTPPEVPTETNTEEQEA